MPKASDIVKSQGVDFLGKLKAIGGVEIHPELEERVADLFEIHALRAVADIQNPSYDDEETTT